MEESTETAKVEDQADAAQPDYLQVAWLLREKLNDFIEGDRGAPPGEKLRRLLCIAASHKVVSCEVVSCDPNLMNPVLWRTLPRELLELVLARLPVPEITRLRCQLSKGWARNMEFNRVCDDANPNMAALVSYEGHSNEFSVRIFDFRKYVWLYVYQFRLRNQGNASAWFDIIGTQPVWRLMADDGGLVCFVSIWKHRKANPLCIVVMNPLTRVQHELPPLRYVYTISPTMVHIKVDSETKGYKVVVVGKKKGRFTVETYDSGSRQWSRVAPAWGRILGRACEWKSRDRNCFRLEGACACAYDLVEGHMGYFSSGSFQCKGASALRYALAKDRMFVLHVKVRRNRDRGGPRVFLITEYIAQNSEEEWVQVKTHVRCTPAEKGGTNKLYACEDVLMLCKTIMAKIGFVAVWTFVQECAFIE